MYFGFYFFFFFYYFVKIDKLIYVFKMRYWRGIFIIILLDILVFIIQTVYLFAT